MPPGGSVLSMRAGTRKRTLKDHPAPGKTPRSRQLGLPVHAAAARLGHVGPRRDFARLFHLFRKHAAGVGDIFAQAVTGSR